MELVVVAGMILDGKAQMTPTNDIPRIAEGGTNVQNLGYTLTNALVVCSGTSCTTYTEWTVINENAGVLEVWAGGRLQRFSNGTWHYE